MTAEFLSGVTGVLLSILFEYFPEASDWYQRKSEAAKRRYMLLFMLLTAIGATGAACAGWWDGLVCNRGAVETVGRALFFAVVGNQGFHRLTKMPSAVTR